VLSTGSCGGRNSSDYLSFVASHDSIRTGMSIRLETYSPWAKSMSFRVESPPLKIGGVYDSYNFATDESGRIVTVSSINKSSN